ncbi:MAG: dihydropteroate synthase [Pyrinomonadaceae bacterium]
MTDSKPRIWRTSKREIIRGEKTLIMGILNVTPDSFSDGGKFFSPDDALRQAGKMISEGADILDVGGESTRPDSRPVPAEEEIRRVVPVIEAIAGKFDVPVSIDTSKAAVAERAIEAGAEIVNDISGLRFDQGMAAVAARTGAGLVLMHSRGGFENMHRQEPVEDIFLEVSADFQRAIEKSLDFGVKSDRICLDVGIGFGKTLEQNLELIGRLDKIRRQFPQYPILVGASRKSFIGKILNDVPADQRSNGTLAAKVIAVWNGAEVVRVHEVRETAEALRVTEAIKRQTGKRTKRTSV